jgi:hypothetical protein
MYALYFVFVLHFAYINKNHYSVFKTVCMYLCMNE